MNGWMDEWISRCMDAWVIGFVNLKKFKNEGIR